MLCSLPMMAMAQQVNKDEKDEQVLTFAEKMPEYPRGTEAMYEYLANSVEYPQRMRKKGLEAKVVATFVVDKEGNIKDIRIVNKVPKEFADETIRVIKGMPRWIPGSNKGKNVSVRYTLPIRFQLN